MSSLHVSYSCLATMMDPQADEWLMNDVIGSETTQRDPEAAAAAAPVDTEIEDEEYSDEVATYSVGDYVRKCFLFHGWFEGTIKSINPNACQGKNIRVWYSDGDCEDMTKEDFSALKQKSVVCI
eukprot:1542036-Ditylum_brightwellii.AAC.1